jgi:bifunctional non-homologous end joining protein LigD
MSLKQYRQKRDFKRSDEPAGRRAVRRGARYLIQKHDASRLHYDFRPELGGVLKRPLATSGNISRISA